ncbi:MAG: SsrA-binding protein SmpB [Hyphomonadaceae bacterium]|nr:SsrA-binding protein SmpB [Clostridia bacterium]
MAKGPNKVLAQNRKAWHDYFIEEAFEAGIALFGTEVKSVRQGMVNLKESYASVQNGEVIVKGMHISPYEKGNVFNKDPLRERKLLMHKSEINKLIGASREKGYALVLLQVYLKGSLVKVEIAIAKGKKNYDRREDIAQRDAKRDVERALRERNKG